MLIVVSGGSGSGKSEYAENISVEFKNNMKCDDLIYIATMKPYGDEALKRIEKHRNMRKNKGFETIECYKGLEYISINKNSVVLLECMSNLAANEIFEEKNKNAVNSIFRGIKNLVDCAKAVVVVTNDIFSDDMDYDSEIIGYIKSLGEINCYISDIADGVVEVVCGIPIITKDLKNKVVQ